jgi:hypothetical protein
MHPSRELAILSTVFGRDIKRFPVPSVDRKVSSPLLLPAYVASYRSRGRRCLLFLTPGDCWWWNGSTRTTLPDLGVQDTVSVFEVEVQTQCIYITDVLVCTGLSVISRDYLERLETGRKWLSAQQHRVVSRPQVFGLPRACPSAHAECYLSVTETLSFVVKRVYPSVFTDTLWEHVPTWADGVVLNPLLTGYQPTVSRVLVRYHKDPNPWTDDQTSPVVASDND